MDLSNSLKFQQTNLEALKSAIQAKMSEDHLVKIWLKLIDELMEDLR